MDAQSGPQRTRRVTRACDRCHSTNTKCAPGLEPTVCRTCFEFRSPCTYQRPVQRRGPKPSSEPPAASRVDVVHSSAMSATTPTGWKYSPLVDHDMILGLVEGFHSIAYPIFPLFHWPSFATKVRQRHYTTDQPLYVTVMAVCAIVVGRQRHTTDSQFPHFQVPSPQTQKPPSKAFYRAAIAAFPTDLSRAQGFEYKRAKVLMAIASIQYGAILEHQTHLGEYVVLACNDGYHDESRWERSLNEIERQERRRLFWSAYTLEVFSAITWDGIVRFRERQSNVCYPAEVYDEDITEHGCNYLANPSFIKGWNFTTDLYRVLEHLVGRLRNRRREPDRISAMFPTAEPSGSDVIAHLEAMQASLPVIYRSAQVMTGDDKQDSFGFQAANIAITFQTVKLALAGAENHSVGKNCEIAGELLDVLAGIPTSYIMAISTPMVHHQITLIEVTQLILQLHHLASCGHILANIIQSPLSPWALIQVRNVLTAMIDLLSGLERSLSLTSDVSVKLRGHVAQIETYMEQAAKTAQQGQVFHGVIPQYIHNTSMAVTAGIDDAHPASGALKNEIMPSNATDTFADDLDSWGNDFTFEWPSDHQIALQTDLTENWPFDFGGGMYDFLGQGNANVQGSSDQGFLDPLGDGANGSQGFTNMQDQREHSGTYEG